MPESKPVPGRTALAVILSPLVAPPLFVLILTVFLGGQWPGLTGLVGGSLFFSIWVLPLAYGGMLVFGLPTALLLEKFGRLNLPWLLPVAAVEGAVVTLLFFMMLSGGPAALNWPNAGSFMAMGAIVAACVALAAWLISGRRK